MTVTYAYIEKKIKSNLDTFFALKINNLYTGSFVVTTRIASLDNAHAQFCRE